jgi:acyl carrier protein
MNRNEISEKVIKIFRYVFDDDDMSITEETSSSDIVEWDSLTHINLIGACELEFNIKFGINEIFKLKSVVTFVDSIEKKLI